jgi:hypothetical protein
MQPRALVRDLLYLPRRVAEQLVSKVGQGSRSRDLLPDLRAQRQASLFLASRSALRRSSKALSSPVRTVSATPDAVEMFSSTAAGQQCNHGCGQEEADGKSQGKSSDKAPLAARCNPPTAARR